jgi:hypothetical protein
MSAFAAGLINALVSGPRLCRGDAIMLSTQPDERSEQRHFIPLAAVIRLNPDDSCTRVGLIRDVSEHGLFFYTDTRPAEGSTIGFAFTLSKPPLESVVVSGTGEVLRVVEPAQGAAIGVAVRVVAPLNIQTATATAGRACNVGLRE